MVGKDEGYEFVIGEDVDDTHPLGDLNRILINGEIMPKRTGASETTGIEKKRILRGEDICFLLEWFQQRRQAFVSNGKWKDDGTWWAPGTGSVTRATFSRKLNRAQALNALYNAFGLCQYALYIEDGTLSLSSEYQRKLIPEGRLSPGSMIYLPGSTVRKIPTSFYAYDSTFESLHLISPHRTTEATPPRLEPVEEAFANAIRAQDYGCNAIDYEIGTITFDGNNYGTYTTYVQNAGSETMTVAGKEILERRRTEFYQLGYTTPGVYDKRYETTEERADLGSEWEDTTPDIRSLWGMSAGEAPEEQVGEYFYVEDGSQWWKKIYETRRVWYRAAPRSNAVLFTLNTRHARRVVALCFLWLSGSKNGEWFYGTVIYTCEMNAAGSQSWEITGNMMPSVEDVMAEADFTVDELEGNYSFEITLGVHPVVFFDDHTKIS